MPTRLPEKEKPDALGQVVYVMLCYITIILILIFAVYGLALQISDF